MQDFGHGQMAGGKLKIPLVWASFTARDCPCTAPKTVFFEAAPANFWAIEFSMILRRLGMGILGKVGFWKTP